VLLFRLLKKYQQKLTSSERRSWRLLHLILECIFVE
jgi:hypothetical protein